MKTTAIRTKVKFQMNPYTIKWAIIAPFGKEFPHRYKSALRKAGFGHVGNGIYADHFNSNNPQSVERIKKQIAKLSTKINTYKRKAGIFSFIITDKQFGLMGTPTAKTLSAKKGWVALPLGDSKEVMAITYNQMYAHGSIQLPMSQASGMWGKTFSGADFKRQF